MVLQAPRVGLGRQVGSFIVPRLFNDVVSTAEEDYVWLTVAKLLNKRSAFYGTQTNIIVSTGPYPKPDAFSPHLPNLFLYDSLQYCSPIYT
jgi:hypothetical protein